MRVVYHSLAVTGDIALYSRQWVQSVRSLRRYNNNVKLVLFIHGETTAGIRAEATKSDVELIECGPYETLFAGVPQHQVASLVAYPVLHKFAHLHKLPKASQVLYLDCDTFFFTDVNLLFDKFADKDFYAREEPRSARSTGDDILDRHMERLALQSGIAFIPCYNMGVCLFNNGSWTKIAKLAPLFFTNVYRFLLGARNVHPGDSFALRTMVGEGDISLEFPPPGSCDPWITEQIALWHTWGHIPGLTHDVLDRDDVKLSADEFVADGGDLVLCHYFHLSEGEFFARVARLT
jgi:Glycosyl transferase family 8